MKKLILTAMVALTASPAYGQLPSLSVGDAHDSDGYSAKIRQVLTENKLYVDLYITGLAEFFGTQPVILKVPSTAGLVDDQNFRVQDLIKMDKYKVTGTESFTTVLGAKKTVFVVEGVALKPGEKTIEQRRREDSLAQAQERLAKALEAQERARKEAEEKAEARRKAREEKRQRAAARAKLEREAASEPEGAAARGLSRIKQIIADLDHAVGPERERLVDLKFKLLDEILENYPRTKAAKEAQDILDKK